MTNVNNGQGWGGGSYFAGGGGGWHNGDAYEFDNGFSSGYWGFQMVCGWAHCTNFGMIYANVITLTATENQGPSLIALGGNNLWYQSGTVGTQRQRRWRVADRPELRRSIRRLQHVGARQQTA